ncbi:unnamed protein product [Urochloa humidicola]
MMAPALRVDAAAGGVRGSQVSFSNAGANTVFFRSSVGLHYGGMVGLVVACAGANKKENIVKDKGISQQPKV